MRIILTIFLITIISSCSEKREVLPKLEGVWKKIGWINYEDGEPTDTIYHPTDSLFNPWNGSVSPGNRYKIYGGGHSIWFYSAIRKDSLGAFNVPDEMFGKTTFSFTKDSIFESFNFWHDKANEYFLNSTEDEIHYSAKYNINGDRYVQYNIREDGKARGEFYERIDNYNEEPTELTGNWTINYVVQVLNNEVVDTLQNNYGYKSGNANFQSFGDKMRIWAYNFKTIDSVGNDISPGQALLSEYEIRNDSIVDKLIYSSSSSEEGGFYASRFSRKFEKIDNELKIYNMNKEGNGRIIHFTKAIN